MLIAIESSSSSGQFLPQYLPYLLHRADQLMSEAFHADLTAGGVQMSEWRVMAVLNDRGSCTISTLAEETRLAQPTVTHAVARLETRGDVERQRGEDDRRQRIVVLTDVGLSKVSTFVDQARRHERAVLADQGLVGADLRLMLQTLISSLEAGKSD